MAPTAASGAEDHSHSWLRRSIGVVDVAPAGLVVVIALVIGALVVVADYVTGQELSFSIFYLAPVVLLAWRLGRRAGLSASAVAAVAWFAVDRWSDNTPSHSLIPVWNGFVRLGFFVIVATLTAELRTLLRRHEDDAIVDQLTGLLNRRGFMLRAAIEVERARRLHSSLTFVYIDLDDFKHINDSAGHAAGDAVLVRMGAAVQASLRGVDVAGRLGGDEFVLVLPDATEEGARHALDRLRSAVVDNAQQPIQFSSGVVAFGDPPISVDDALRQADEAMYRAKQQGQPGDTDPLS